jgi:hypothetical protein
MKNEKRSECGSRTRLRVASAFAQGLRRDESARQDAGCGINHRDTGAHSEGGFTRITRINTNLQRIRTPKSALRIGKSLISRIGLTASLKFHVSSFKLASGLRLPLTTDNGPLAGSALPKCLISRICRAKCSIAQLLWRGRARQSTANQPRSCDRSHSNRCKSLISRISAIKYLSGPRIIPGSTRLWRVGSGTPPELPNKRRCSVLGTIWRDANLNPRDAGATQRSTCRQRKSLISRISERLFCSAVLLRSTATNVVPGLRSGKRMPEIYDILTIF